MGTSRLTSEPVPFQVNRSLSYGNFSSFINLLLEENQSSSSDYTYKESISSDEESTADTLELSDAAQAGLISLYTTTIFLSIAGNLTVMVVLGLGSRSKAEITVFLFNLAVADLFMGCFCMPFTFTQTMLGRWIFGSFMCPLVLFMQVTSVAVSIFTNMAIGIDRWVNFFDSLFLRIFNIIMWVNKVLQTCIDQ